MPAVGGGFTIEKRFRLLGCASQELMDYAEELTRRTVLTRS